jgi:ATP synthase protein I
MALVMRKYADEVEEEPVRRLSSQEVRDLRANAPSVSPCWVLGVQCLAGLMLVAGVWLVLGRSDWAGSVAYGSFAVWVPAALFAYGLSRQKNAPGAGAALVGMFVWELVKITLTVLLLLLAPKVVVELNWLALLGGFVVTMKASWVAMMWQHRNNLSNAKS